MLRHLTRAKVIQIWFGGAALIVAASLAFGAEMTVGTGVMLAAFCIVLPAIILMVWPGGEQRTVAEVLHHAEDGR
jgi:hypothetical protein